MNSWKGRLWVWPPGKQTATHLSLWDQPEQGAAETVAENQFLADQAAV